MRLWKTLDSKMCSRVGDESPWEIGVWKKVNGQVEVFENGFHATKNIIDSLRYFGSGLLCEVEARGEHDLTYNDIEAWSEMRVLRFWNWSQKDNVALAVFASEFVLRIFEKAFPSDWRPRKAIEAAKEWLNDPSEENRQAAEKAAEAANEAARMVASLDDKKEGVIEAALAARDAARAVVYEELAAKFAIDSTLAAEAAVAKVTSIDEMRRIMRNEFHNFVIKRLEEK